jgi:hypothetical protein
MIGAFIKMSVAENDKKEGFSGGIRMTSCPSGSVTYTTKGGDTNCCNGDIVDGQCNGTNMCSLSPTSSGIASCSDWLVKEWRKRTERFCPKSMHNYFGTLQRTPGSEGCSASVCNDNGSGPSDGNAAKCTIYGSDELNLGKRDSCVNIQARDAMQCPQANATKEITANAAMSNGKLPPALLKCTYIPTNRSSYDIPVHCTDVPRFKLYVGSTLPPQWAAAATGFIDSYASRDVNFCPASKAYFVDGTLTRANATGLPGPQVCPPAPACPTKK